MLTKAPAVPGLAAGLIGGPARADEVPATTQQRTTGGSAKVLAANIAAGHPEKLLKAP